MTIKKEMGTTVMKNKGLFTKAVLAGMFISIGATIYLSCTNKIVGAFLFAVGLSAVCIFQLNLFTGKIGYVIENKSYLAMPIIWLGNLLGGAVSALLIRWARPSLFDTASGMLKAKSEINVLSLFICGIFCGVIMFTAVDIYKRFDNFGRFLGILIGVPVFILCGFEHSIADMCYFAFAVSTLEEFLRAAHIVVIVSVANSIGAIILWLLLKSGEKKASGEKQ